MQMQILFTWDQPPLQASYGKEYITVHPLHAQVSECTEEPYFVPFQFPLSPKSCARRQTPSLRNGAIRMIPYPVLRTPVRMMYSVRSASHGYHAEILTVSTPSSYFTRRLTTARSWFEAPNLSRTAYLQSHLRLAGSVGFVCRQSVRRRGQSGRLSSIGTPYSVLRTPRTRSLGRC